MTELSPETQARNIIERLKMFNRKERDHLMKFALCDKPEEPRISPALWEMVGNSPTMPEPDEMFIGMDYHLNWLYAALATAHHSDLRSSYKNEWHEDIDAGDGNERPIKRSQEDVDLIIAWTTPKPHTLHLVLIEAKLDSSWGSQQFKSKKKRLTLLREDAEARGLNCIDWRFLLMSPKDAPTKNEFDLGNISERHKWLLDKTKAKADQKLWHEKLPVHTTLRRVGRKTDSSDEWLTAVSLKTSKASGSSDDDT